MKLYGKPKLLKDSEYENFITYVHLEKDSTELLRKGLIDMKNNKDYADYGMIGFMKNGIMIIEMPLNDNINCMQILFKKLDHDFKIYHIDDDDNHVLKFDVNLLMMMIGGVDNSNKLLSLPKEEIVFMISKENEFEIA